MIQEEICKMLKDMYFEDKEWQDCYREVAKKLNALKIKAKTLFANDQEMYNAMKNFSKDDFDMLG